MRNVLSAIVAAVVGSFLLAILLGIPEPIYPEPFNIAWMLLAGSEALAATASLGLTSVIIPYLITWLVVGFLIGPFSRVGWNTLRSTLWVGFVLAIFALASELLLNPGFWILEVNPDRNYDLLILFISSLIIALLSLPTALASSYLTNRLGQQAEPEVPIKIETICECGAVFKSKPMLCAECGRSLTD